MWNSALHYAVFCRKSTDILDWLLRVGFDVNSYSCIVTPLHVVSVDQRERVCVPFDLDLTFFASACKAAINSDVQTTEWLLRLALPASLLTNLSDQTTP